jgi:putative endonuclease
MLDRDILVFVEVRYRRDARFGGGAASVDAGKRRKLVKAAQAFLAAHRRFADAPCRFDVVDASGDPASPAFDWLRDAFRADDG